MANPFCNDLAVRNDGSLYVTDTNGAKVFMFAKGKTEAVEVASDPLLAGADGLAFLSDATKLYVNSVTTGNFCASIWPKMAKFQRSPISSFRARFKALTECAPSTASD